MKKVILFFVVISFILTSCSEDFSIGERVGLVTQFSRTGLMFKTWEGRLNVTQTGMNSSHEFDFSIDKHKEDEQKAIIDTLLLAQSKGWKVDVFYHQVKGKNYFGNRGETNYFVDSIKVLSKDIMSNTIFNNDDSKQINLYLYQPLELKAGKGINLNKVGNAIIISLDSSFSKN